MSIYFVIRGKPISKARPRFKRYGKTYDPQEAEKKAWQWEVNQQLQEQGLFTGFLKLIPGPIILKVTFIMPTPKNTSKKIIKELEDEKMMWHDKRPDLDNMIKWVKDCLNEFLWEDDSQVCVIHAMKVYGLKGKTEIEIEEL